jgi:hypothetical protein
MYFDYKYCEIDNLEDFAKTGAGMAGQSARNIHYPGATASRIDGAAVPENSKSSR